MMKSHLLLTVGLLLFVSLCNAQTGIITTVAGNGYTVGDGGAASDAAICNPLGVAADRHGNIYVADICDNRVRKISASGIITTFAGNGVPAYTGDGGPATAATLHWPYGVAVDAIGNVYIADEMNYAVRKVNTAGVISTIAGVGTYGFSGDGGPATNAHLFYPTDVAVDATGNIFIADFDNNRIRKVTAGIITTFAGSAIAGYAGDGGAATSASLYQPIAVAVDAASNVYIADYHNNAVRKVSGGIITTVAGNGSPGYTGDGGPATAASLTKPTGVAVDVAGNLYISDNAFSVVRVVHAATHIINLFAGNSIPGFLGDGGPATAAELNSQYGLATDSAGNVFIADGSNNRVREVNTSGIISTFAGTSSSGTYSGLGSYGGDGGLAVLAYLNDPKGVSIDNANNIYIADQMNNRIRYVKTPGNIIRTVAGNGVAGYSGDGGLAILAELNLPCGVCTNGGDFYIADMRNNVIRKVHYAIITTIAGNGTAGYSGDGGLAVSAKLNSPTDVAIDNYGNLFIADRVNNRVRKIDTMGIITTVAGNGTSGYSGDGGPAISAELNFPSGIAVDRFGNLYIADYFNYCIRKVNAAGVITTIAGTGAAGYSGDGGLATAAQLSSPPGVAVDYFGNVYISDEANYRIRKIDTTGIISSVCGNGVNGFWGDGGMSDTAEIYNTYGIALDDSANIFIADTHNQRVRKIENVEPLALPEHSGSTYENTIDVFPNPTQGAFTINIYAAVNEQTSIIITGVTGEIIKNLNVMTNAMTKINLNIPEGLYFITATAPDFKINSKFVVMR